MSKKHWQHPSTLQLVQSFVSSQRKLYSSQTVSKYKNVLVEWQSFLDGWGWECLAEHKPEALEYAKNSRYKTYSTIFGADMIPYSVWDFLETDIEEDYGVIGAKYAATVIGKFAAWLRDKAHISDEDYSAIRREIKEFRARFNE
ncbi:MAG TPA: hypothetical protein VKM55_24540 [Candidatus Lokiarchaeia archaeon]|nr:hypothetical protein [Candidatus Lokiarchaeia archaeon]